MKEIFDVLPDLLIFIPFRDIDLLLKIFSLVYVLVLLLVDLVLLKLLFYGAEEEGEEMVLKRDTFDLSYKIALLIFMMVFFFYRLSLNQNLNRDEDYSFVIFLVSFFLLGFVILKLGFVLARQRVIYKKLMVEIGGGVRKADQGAR